ncbi:MAG: thiol-disulfide oxidoreductase DCC family protein [Beijerinckiaceae bacterium]
MFSDRPLPNLTDLQSDDIAFLSLGPVWVFDSVCVLCSNAVRLTLKHEYPSPTPVRFVAIQSQLGRRLAIAYGIDPEKPNTFLWLDQGIALERTSAIMSLARTMGGPARFAPLLRPIPRAMRDWLYDRIALNRYALFGKLDACHLPEAQHAKRFTLS